MSKAQVDSAVRSGCALTVYRVVLNVALLVVAFRTFPEYRTLLALAVLVFSQGIAAIGAAQQIVFTQQNHLDDLAERKTRHAIVLASESDRSYLSFWSEVDRRVADEMGTASTPPRWWARVGLTIVQFMAYLLGDAVMIVTAFAIT